MTILAIDDDRLQLELLSHICAGLSYPVIEFHKAETLATGMDMLRRLVVDLVLTDLVLPDGSGFDLLRGAKELNPTIAVVIMTAFEDTSEAVRLLKAGADDYLVKPLRKDELIRLFIRINETTSLVREALLPPAAGLPASPAVAGIVYRDLAMASLLSMAARAAPSGSTILLGGESGTGKELVARFIHERSGRRGPFVPVNIAALPENLAESELFGHARGAFTGAATERAGRFEAAEGGTLFLDEIGEAPLALQAKLLRAIQFGEIERVGENLIRRPDVRIISATNRDLAELVAASRFRRDLFYRVNVIELRLPPLRERKADIRPLVDHFVARFAARDGKRIDGLSREAFDALAKRSFPGNVRELENLIERAVVLCRASVIQAEDLPPEAAPATEAGAKPPQPAIGYLPAMNRFERELIIEAVRTNGGNRSAAARALGIGERHLRSCIQRLGISAADFDK